MQPKYKVEYIESQILAKNDDWKKKGNIDGYHTSKDVEALILERSTEGYRLESIVPVTGTAWKSPSLIQTTIGFLVTFHRA